MCIRRYYSYGKDGSLYHDKAFDLLMVCEWKAPSFKPTMLPSNKLYHRSYIKPHYQPTQPQTPLSVDYSDMEWVDLGLPSGTLWAKADIDGKMSFNAAR